MGLKELLFASRNKGKFREASALLQPLDVKLLSVEDFSGAPEVVEDGTTFQENALKKARCLAEYSGIATIADDSGLEVECLGGRPGVYSSRFAGPDATDQENTIHLLGELEGVPLEKRTAAFRCVLALFDKDGSYNFFEGTLEGFIAFELSGAGGFGYDPIFLLPDGERTVAELDPEEKNRISHRGKAFEKLIQFLSREL